MKDSISRTLSEEIGWTENTSSHVAGGVLKAEDSSEGDSGPYLMHKGQI